MGFYLIWQTKNVRRWRDTNGKILSFKEEGGLSNKRAVVHYSYLANGVFLEGTRITICDPVLAGGYVPVRRLARLFPTGKAVTVYFDERHPKKSVLKKSSYLLPVVIFVCGVVAEIYMAWWIGGGNILPPELGPTIIHF